MWRLYREKKTVSNISNNTKQVCNKVPKDNVIYRITVL